ncbi:hypothetical protein Pla175_27280 [Pirellulimonas nuda]|uniref:Uncharacterized protein n=1 Tax=Pirellulimonas nuda TaxID=2528009 RepID=A0A518DCZ8_9BACT|nr:right-handed parallel beta-helix repeat-containing protein [Pirellulimonas nuda]QDU89339.1 hypothetical protein Pla175_27280 [Pirellulimonas nuda]
MAVTTDVDGWTVVSPSADSRVIYVSSSLGNDANDGLSEATPKATVSAGTALMRDGYPDHLLFKRGDVWTNENLGSISSGRSAEEPKLIGAYGSGERPVFLADPSREFSNNIKTKQYIAIIGLHMEPNDREHNDFGKYGLRFAVEGNGNFLVEDNYIGGFAYNLSFVIPATDVDAWGGLVIRRNVIADAWSATSHSQGLFISRAQSVLLEENVFDHNGWHKDYATGSGIVTEAEPTIFNHNVYISERTRDITIRGNIFSRGSSMGTKMDVDAGTHTIENNLYVGNGMIAQFGEGSDDLSEEVDGNIFYISNNVMVEGTARAQPNGLGAVFQNIVGGYFQDNFIGQRGTEGGDGGYALAFLDLTDGRGINNFAIDSNIIHDWRAPTRLDDPEARAKDGRDDTQHSVSGNTFSNNMLIEDSSSASPLLETDWTSTDEATYGSNTYYRSGATSDALLTTDSSGVSTGDWQATYEPDAVFEKPSFVDPARTTVSYAATLGLTSFDALANQWKLQSRETWNANLKAAAINEYIRSGFEVDEVGVSPLPNPQLDTPEPNGEEAGSDSALPTLHDDASQQTTQYPTQNQSQVQQGLRQQRAWTQHQGVLSQDEEPLTEPWHAGSHGLDEPVATALYGFVYASSMEDDDEVEEDEFEVPLGISAVELAFSEL